MGDALTLVEKALLREAARQHGFGELRCTRDEAIWNAAKRYAAPVPAREKWRHVKTGGVYEVIVPTALREWDHCACVVYRGEDGRTWVRPCSEFYDGRFERISPPPAADK